MRHRLLLIVLALSVWGSFGDVSIAQQAETADDEAAEVSAQSGWPRNPISPDYFRGRGYYFSIGKIITCFLLFLAWVRTADWINQDLQFHKLRVNTWNPIVVGSFSVALLLMWAIPFFWIALLIMIAAYFVPVLVYVYSYRNPLVEEHLRVLTPDHIQFWLGDRLKLPVKSGKRKNKNETIVPATVKLLASGGESSTDDQAATKLAEGLPGYPATAVLLEDAYRRRATAVLLNFGEDVGVRYMIDGVWHNLPAQPLEAGRHVTDVLAKVGHMGEPVQRGKGQFQLQTAGQKTSSEITRSTKDAERWLVKFLGSSEQFETPSDLGMRGKTAERLQEIIGQSKGMLLFSAMPAGGLTTSIDVAVRQVDRFMRDFVSIEDAGNPETEIVNVDRRTYDGAVGESPATIIATVSRGTPDVILCRNMVNTESAKMLCEQSVSDDMVIGSIAAKDSVEALLRVLVMKVPPATFAQAIVAVLHGRLIRKLCESCREPYQPSPELLKKLGIPVGKIEQLYRKRQDPEAPLCSTCDGIGYYGRTGIYELLEVDDSIRQILTSGKPDLDALRKAARAAGLQTETDHGVLLVARGITSVEELQRALKA